MDNAFEKRIRAYALMVKRMQKTSAKPHKAAPVKRSAAAGLGAGGGCLR